MSGIPKLANKDLSQIAHDRALASQTNRYGMYSGGTPKFTAQGVQAVKAAILDGGKVTASERQDLNALMYADMFLPEDRAAMNQLIGLPPDARPTPPPSPDTKKLANKAISAMKALQNVVPASNSQSYGAVEDHNRARYTADVVGEAFQTVSPASPEGRELVRAFNNFSALGAVPADNTPPTTEYLGHVVVSNPSVPMRSERPLVASGTSWALDMLSDDLRTAWMAAGLLVR